MVWKFNHLDIGSLYPFSQVHYHLTVSPDTLAYWDDSMQLVEASASFKIGRSSLPPFCNAA
jgi:hypothetical protein